ncbi:MAG TPA: hypothetical protein ENN63_11065 [Bacteroidetes bacterium]|nr:hypothetical protein [Bacteroidota bacterium]
MKNSFLMLASVMFLTKSHLQAQNNLKSLEISGYVSSMQTTMFTHIDSAWMTENLIHQRLNVKWYATPDLTMAVEVRNRFIFGEFVKNIPGYDRLIDREQGWWDLSGYILSGNSFLLHSTIDRGWIDYTRGNWQIRAGRQRINWGVNYAWNPNDLFNTYSFFDFDYPEKPGSDALRIQYYTGVSSMVEAAVKVNAREQITAAGKWKFNRWNYDFQLIGGLINDEDVAAGAGWSGNIAGAGFRGEVTYLHPVEHFTDTSGILIASVGADYTFPGSLYLQAEILYNGAEIPVGGFEQYYYMPLSVKNLSFTDWSFLLGATYPVTPLFQAGTHLMMFPSIKGWFAGPTLNYSLGDNLHFSFATQHFSGHFDTPVPGGGRKEKKQLTLGYLRFKYSF